jgi:hypothetical protein
MQITRSPQDTPQLTLAIKSPIDTVWRSLRDKKEVLRWHGWDTPSIEEEVDTIYFTDAKEETPDGRERTLVVNGGDAFHLKAEKAGTLLTVVRAKLGGNPEWDAYYDNITEGWVSFVEQLRFLLERSPKGPRKAIYATQAFERSDVLKGLGLKEAKAAEPFRGRFQEEDVSGEVWFDTPNQIGLVINEWGPGLVVFQFSEKAVISTRYPPL